MSRRRTVLSAALAAAAVVGASAARGQDTETGEEPLRVEGSDRVEVEMVLLDVLVLDRKDRTVPGLGIDDFRLVLDGRPIRAETLDVRCDGSVDDVVNDQRFEPPEEAVDAPPRNFVLVFDYFHMASAKESLEQARDAVERLRLGGERHMIAVVGESLRVELPFTDDRRQVADTLERMILDPTLYAGSYGRLTERRFYERLLSLFDLMELIPGRKVMVLFSGPFLADGWHHDVYYRELAARASSTRTSVYPVDTRGLAGGIPPKLARIATVTGGRITGRTNDLALAYARAQRDLSCTYTLGFRARPGARRNRRISVYVEREGVRAVHASGYAARTRVEQLDSMTHTAGMAADLFDSGGMSGEVFVLEPRSARRWQVTLAATIPEETRASFGGLGRWRAGGKVRKTSGTLVHRFRRETSAEDDHLLESFSVRPGDYVANLWLYNELMDFPLALPVRFHVPPVPDDGPFLVGPFLGDAAGTPLSDARSARGEPLRGWIRLCRPADTPGFSAEVRRRIVSADGTEVRALQAARVDLAGGAGVVCRRVTDEGLAAGLEPGSYRFEVRAVTSDGTVGRAELPFDILAR